ncbi:adenosylcobalamin-dependent ribonucleoside-diphosphate reductase [Maledivibacter halophilus]|uniref:Vitamin B12-dependent ribonucleotide reductase n=1 Tax=Maledivibacter halophilus TaxID=36842 RepID=A0A1T5MIN0_9FIRM|nr:adenosylcobalamin-dependent ribonucleoside-diphosphate reductase [Maledivibacter halophilus]SKC88097.1 ribonucleoside-diphosphate reductase class II [Maledivibacter halophilus]
MEQPLLPFESCNLGSINLSKMVKEEEGRARIDYERLGEVIDLAVRFLDNVIDINNYPLKEIEETTKANRKIGLGVMGFADMLVGLGIPYNSDEGVKIAEEIMKFTNERSKKMSMKLAEERGSFPNYEKSIFKKENLKLRNGTTTTIAPTGSISIISGTSSGIEPLFALCYYRNVMDNDKLIEVNPLFKEYLEKEGIYSEELMEKVAEKGSIQDIPQIPEYIKRIFVTAHDISPEWHIKMQAAFQKYVDNAVSKTVNFEHDATKEEVERVYILAYKLGCKGVTIYRDGSRDEQVLNIGKLDNGNDEKAVTKDIKGIVPRSRPSTTMGITEKVKIGCGNLYITANYDEKGICEVFTNLGRAGGCPSQSEATSRLISIALRAGISAEAIIEQLKGIRCHSTLRLRGKGDKEINVLSCPDAIGKTLEKVMNMNIAVDEENIEDIAHEIQHKESKCMKNCSNSIPTDIHNSRQEKEISIDIDNSLEEGRNDSLCPECGSKVEHEGGCVMCRNCGYSKCG